MARHGERSPEPYYDLVDGPNFQVDYKNLTRKGAETHYELGRGIREQAKDLQIGMEYDAQDVYVLSTFKQRAIDSATAQMMGLYDRPLSWPLPAER